MDFQKEIVSQEISRTGVRTILVATDFSEYSDMALQEAIGIAQHQNARIYLLHVRRFTEKRGVDSPEAMIRAQIKKISRSKIGRNCPRCQTWLPLQRDSKGAGGKKDRVGYYCFPRERGAA